MRVFGILISMVIMMALVGCATNATINDQTNASNGAVTIDTARALALSKIVARTAGRYVAINNPAVSASVISAWSIIQDETGNSFRSIFLDRLQQYLESQGVKDSTMLRADAADILSLFGYDINTTTIDAEFLEGIDVGTIKAIVGAFIEGMSLAEVAG